MGFCQAAGYSPLAEAAAADDTSGEAPAAISQADRHLPSSWRWWAARALLAQQRLLSGRAASIQEALQALLPHVMEHAAGFEGDSEDSSGITRCAW